LVEAKMHHGLPVSLLYLLPHLHFGGTGSLLAHHVYQEGHWIDGIEVGILQTETPQKL
jgi:hypothetical protein